MKQLIDQLGIFHTFEKTPVRIVSLVPSQTELLCDLGLEDKIVGVTKFCVHPGHLKKSKKIVGGTKQVSFDKIKALQPDIVICNKEENTLEIVEELRKLCPVWVTDIYTIKDNFQMITDFGHLFECGNKAAEWNEKLASALDDFKVFMKEIPIRNTAYFIWKNPYMVAGSNTFINEMLELNHFQNKYKSIERYPEIEIEKIQLDGSVDLILLSSEPYPFQDKDRVEMEQYTKNAKTIIVDGEMFSWYGSRLLKAFGYFKKMHQDLSIAIF